jgi:hypothetical protein
MLSPRRPESRKGRAALKRLLSYRNPDVIDRYLKDFGGTRKEAGHIFRATLKWLYLSQQANSAPCFISSDLIKIDEMWHTFILFTRDYMNFCLQQFGCYVHHQPSTNRDAKSSPGQVRRKFRSFYELVYDTLGEETFREWFFSGRFRRAADLRSASPR